MVLLFLYWMVASLIYCIEKLDSHEKDYRVSKGNYEQSDESQCNENILRRNATFGSQLNHCGNISVIVLVCSVQRR